MNSAISRRLEKALLALFEKDYETSLMHCFPAIDKTASARRPKQGVGARFKEFLNDQRNIIAPIGLGVKMGKGCTFGGISFEEAVYKLARNHLFHEGELAANFQITTKQGSMLGGDWQLSEANIVGLIIATISAKENANESFSRSYEIGLFDQQVDLNKLWGQESQIMEMIEKEFSKNNHKKSNAPMQPSANELAD